MLAKCAVTVCLEVSEKLAPELSVFCTFVSHLLRLYTAEIIISQSVAVKAAFVVCVQLARWRISQCEVSAELNKILSRFCLNVVIDENIRFSLVTS